MNIDKRDLELLRYVQDGIPIEKRPFHKIASSIGMDEKEVIERLKKLMEEGKIRRFSASIAHLTIGIKANAMCAWDIPDSRIEEIGKICAAFPEVTHCYQRPKKNEWRYNLFMMIHGRTPEECERIIEKIEERIGIHNRIVLFSERELKKTGVRI
ncbi:MAG: siroheme decarboxylase subunit beta [Candidatus Syntropharchaeia archaeon]